MESTKSPQRVIRFSLWGRVGLVSVFLVLLASPTHAVVVFKTGSNKPIAGHLVRKTNAEVVVREELPGGQVRELVIPRSEIEDLIESVSPERLSALDPARPQEYREYAEELAEKKLDPEARHTAVRLFQIAAWLDPQKTGRGALLGLVALARDAEEEARFRAAAYLFDPRHDKALLGPRPTAGAGGGGTRDDSPHRGLLEAVRQLRRGHGQQARAAIAPPAVADELAARHSIITREEFLLACGLKEINSEQLRKLLLLELTLENDLSGRGDDKPVEAATTASWRAALQGNNLAPVPSLKFEMLTEFDPRECVYREGKWLRPGGEGER